MAQDGVVYIDTLQHLSVTLVASVTGQNIKDGSVYPVW